MMPKKADKDKKKGAVTRNGNIIASGVIIIFFVIVIFAYYLMLHEETKNNIIVRGELNAESSTERINRYLSMGMDCITLIGYTLDNMLLDKRSTADMEEYLIDQTAAVSNIMAECTTGVYAYINGIYLDGAGWVPDDDYIPTERPWYIQAKARLGQVVVVDPYLDAQTGSVMITLVKMLCDAKSVVALDVTLDELQEIVEELPAKDAFNTEMILTRNYQVIAHSNRGEIGKDYLAETDSLGHAITETYRRSGSNSFSVEHEGTEYMVYALPLENEWICLSIIDTTHAYNRLWKPLALTIVVSLLFVIIMLFIMNNSRRKSLLAEKLEKETASAIAANEAKSTFLANMSHEIRTPINTVLGMNEMILRECGDEEILSYSTSVRSAAQSLLGIVNDILDFSRIEAGKFEIVPEDYDLSLVLNDLVSMIQTRIDEKGLTLTLDFDPGTPKLLHGDEVRFKQIITNILTNAVKYTESGCVTFRIGYERDSDDPDQVTLHAEITDTGIGIRKEDMEKLFLKFERIDENRNRNIEGTGLGLSITKSLLEMMGSSLQVSSEYGKGSSFSFALKQRVVEWEPLGDFTVSCKPHMNGYVRYKERFVAPDAEILMVDDNSMNLMVFRSLVRKTLMHVDTAKSGDQGIALARTKKYDIIFLDHMMPGKDGIETLHELRDLRDEPNADTPVICLTANAISGAREKYISAGFDDYLTKPVDVDRLEDMLIRFLPKDKLKQPVPEDTATLQEEGKRDHLPEGLTMLRDEYGFDIDAGIHNCGDMDSYMQMLEAYHDTIDEVRQELDLYYHEERFKDYTIRVHALKSSSRTIGAMMLGESTLKLEKAGKNGELDYIREHHQPVMESFVRLKEPLAAVINRETGFASSDKPEADAELMRSFYIRLVSAAEDADPARLDRVLDEMDGFVIPASDEKVYEEVRQAACAYSYERVLAIIQDKM